MLIFADELKGANMGYDETWLRSFQLKKGFFRYYFGFFSIFLKMTVSGLKNT